RSHLRLHVALGFRGKAPVLAGWYCFGWWGAVLAGLPAPKAAPPNRSFKPNPLRPICRHVCWWGIVQLPARALWVGLIPVLDGTAQAVLRSPLRQAAPGL